MTTHRQLAAAMGPDPLLSAMLSGAKFRGNVSGLGEATALTPQQSATLLNLGLQYASWREQVLTVAGRVSDDTGAASTMRNLVDTASRQFNKLIGGDLAMGVVLQTTMSNTMALIREINADNSPSLQDAYTATGAAISSLVVSIGRTAGSAAGALLKAAADELQVKPAEVGSGIKYVAVAGGLAAGAYILFQLRMIFGRRR